MSALADTVFAKADPADIRTDPFPHLVIRDALPAARVAELRGAMPDPERGMTRPATRVALSTGLLTTMGHIDPVWAAFSGRHARPDIVAGIRALFADHWPAHLAGLDLDGARYGPVSYTNPDETADILTDARLEVITPNPDAPAAHRAAHLDGAERIFSALFYLRDPVDDGTGGGLGLYRFRGARPDGAEAMNVLPPEAVERVVEVPYEAGTLVVFPNRPDAIHAAETRGPSTIPRRYVFITAEARRPLY